MSFTFDNDSTRAASDEQLYLLKVCRALMLYGAPTHRLESYVKATSQVLALDTQAFYLPGCMFLSFDNKVQIIRCTQSLNLSKLKDIHAIYKDVIHARITAAEASIKLGNVMDKQDKFRMWFRIAMYGLASAAIGPVSYGAHLADLPIIFALGSLVGFLELYLSQKSELYGYIFEISATIVVSFIARALGSVPGNIFCFSAISQASIVMILPGLMITNSALELQSRNIASGATRMVYGIIYTLFLAFGTTVGATIWGAIDPNAVSDTQCRGDTPFWWQIMFVPLFATFYVLVNQAQWRDVPGMTTLTLVGWIVSFFSGKRFATNPQLAQVFGALSVGLLANVYSRAGFGMAFQLMVSAIFILVPGSFAAQGGLVSGVKSANSVNSGDRAYEPNTSLLQAGYTMIEIAIGLTVGLSVASLIVYPFRKKNRKSGIFSF